jgi:hypothetical protein
MKTLMIFLLSLSPLLANASSTLDHGTVIPAGTYRGILELQGANGLNVVGRMDMGINESTGVRALLGTGAMALQWGLYYKWVPIPDYAKQPAIGLLGGFTFTRVENTSAVTLKVHPMFSKRLKSDIGDVIPYVSVPVGIRVADGKTTVPVQLAIGAELQANSLNKFSLWIEGGANVSNAEGYISFAGSHAF